MKLQLSKRTLAIVALLLAIGGLLFAVANFMGRPSAQESTAQNFVNNLIKDKTEQAFKSMTPRLQSYGIDYWVKGQFGLIKDYKSQPKITERSAPKAKDSTLPPPYLDSSQAMSYSYQFELKGLTYNLEVVVIKTTDGWKINEYNGDYKT